ncbi:Jerky [Araneus ventricosus]|uniref:Jerky n=1 Tax=Araneus ventricosus TaxID=182803 RepID=A0A4Y2PBJ0_ARAVE|nr:Jerky [Araneus ventricosus]
MKGVIDEELDNVLYKWFIQKRSANIRDNNPTRSPEFQFEASSGWLEKFKNCHGICQMSIVREKLSSDIEAGISFIAKLQDLIVMEKLTADQIYNFDETGIYWRALPTETLDAENEAVAPGRKKMKDRVMILGCANASGSHRV